MDLFFKLSIYTYIHTYIHTYMFMYGFYSSTAMARRSSERSFSLGQGLVATELQEPLLREVRHYLCMGFLVYTFSSMYNVCMYVCMYVLCTVLYVL